MTVVLHIPGHGGHLMLFGCENRGEQLRLTPITMGGPRNEETTTWFLSSAGVDTNSLP